MLQRRLTRQQESISLSPVVDARGLRALQRVVETVTVEQSVVDYCVRLASATRMRSQVLVGASPRGSLALVLVARAWAVLHGRDFVTPEDVKAVAIPALSHRITLRPEMWMRDVSTSDVVRAVLNEVPAPTPRGLPT